MEREGKYLVFDNDAEFEDFAIDTTLRVHKGKGGYWYDWDFTPMYIKELDNGTKFVITDPASCIRKRGCVSYHCVCKPVELASIFEYEDYKETEH